MYWKVKNIRRAGNSSILSRFSIVHMHVIILLWLLHEYSYSLCNNFLETPSPCCFIIYWKLVRRLRKLHLGECVFQSVDVFVLSLIHRIIFSRFESLYATHNIQKHKEVQRYWHWKVGKIELLNSPILLLWSAVKSSPVMESFMRLSTPYRTCW